MYLWSSAEVLCAIVLIYMRKLISLYTGCAILPLKLIFVQF